MQHKCHNICPTILVLGRLRKHVLDAGRVFLLLEIAAVSPADINFIHDTQKNTLLFPPSTKRTTVADWNGPEENPGYATVDSQVYTSCTALIKKIKSV